MAQDLSACQGSWFIVFAAPKKQAQEKEEKTDTRRMEHSGKTWAKKEIIFISEVSREWVMRW